MMSGDGYTLLRDSEGYIVYAESRKGILEPSSLRYRNGNSAEAMLRGIMPGLTFDDVQVSRICIAAQDFRLRFQYPD